MRMLLIGGSGMLGSDLQAVASRRGWEVIAPPSSILNLIEPESVGAIATGEFGALDWVVNCAAYTAVDKAESESDDALALNALGPGYVARACAMVGAPLTHISTDFVFNGTSGTPIEETERTSPLGVYGRSKLLGEQAVLSNCPEAFVVRTSWLFGPNGASFPRTMLRAWLAGKSLRVVGDQVGNPTYTWDLAETLVQLKESMATPGIYHATGPDSMSWFDLARITIDCASKQMGRAMAPIDKIATEDYPTPATRPAYSVLSNTKLQSLGVAPMRPMGAAVDEFLVRLRDLEPGLFQV